MSKLYSSTGKVTDFPLAVNDNVVFRLLEKADTLSLGLRYPRFKINLYINNFHQIK